MEIILIIAVVLGGVVMLGLTAWALRGNSAFKKDGPESRRTEPESFLSGSYNPSSLYYGMGED